MYNGIKYASRNLRNKIAFNLVGSKKDCEGHLFTIQGSNSFVIIPKLKINVSTTTYHVGVCELSSMRRNFLHSIFRSFTICWWRIQWLNFYLKYDFQILFLHIAKHISFFIPLYLKTDNFVQFVIEICNSYKI